MRHFCALLGFLFISATAFGAIPCDQVRIRGEVQIVFFDGAGTVIGGRNAFAQQQLHVTSNPVMAEPGADGRINLNVYRANELAPDFGQLIVTMGWLSLGAEGPYCQVDLKIGNEPVRTYEVVKLSARGDVILGDLSHPQRAPIAVIQVLDPR